MKGNLGTRFLIIAAVLGFLGWHAWRGVFGGELELGIDLQGGSELIFKFDFDDRPEAERAPLLDQAIAIVRDRVDSYGLKEIVLQPIGSDRFSVQVSARERENVEAIKDLITVLGKLEFRITVEPSAATFSHYWEKFRREREEGLSLEEARLVTPDERADTDVGAGRYPHGLRWHQLSQRAMERGYDSSRLPVGEDGRPEPWVLVRLDEQDITGDDLENVYAGLDSQSILGGGGWQVHFGVKRFAQGRMADLTANEGEFMAIVLNDRVDSAPRLNETLSSNGVITGGFSEEEARSLAAVLQAGALQEKPVLVSESTIAPELAGDARRTGILSTLVGFVFVMLMMLWLYIGPGMLANLALLLNLVILVGTLAWFDAVLTLPGIAGVVLTVGMAVDANILIFERIKEERARGRTLLQAVMTGYDKALVTIVDANLTTLITAYFLFQIGSGPIRGFGITLAIGILSSMFTAIYVTRTVFVLLLRKNVIREARMRGDWKPWTVPWMSYKKPAAIASAILVVGGIVLYAVVPEEAKFDLDFTQGSKLVMRFHEEVPRDEVEARLAGMAEQDPLYGKIAVRATAEGIGEQVAIGESAGYEMRSQRIATREEIDAFVDRLRSAFAQELLPGPFRVTLRAAEDPGLSVGEVYFTGDVAAAHVQAALRAHGATSRWRAEPIAPPPGARSAFRVHVDTPVQNEAEIALNLRRAFDVYDPALAAADLEAFAAGTEGDDEARAEARELAAAVTALPPPGEGYWNETDPFPLADRVDPFTAQQHRDGATRAIALSIFAIILYVAFRFRSWAFGFAAVLALVHDVAVALGVVALVSWLGVAEARLNLVTVAAFLTLIGYSINDTIVIFDRVRELRGSAGRARLGEIIDRSLNETMARTIRTSFTTWVVVVILLVLNYGVNAPLEGFAFILTIGIVAGTYSTIFIAAPTLVFLPWLWEKCGRSAKVLARRVAYYAAAIAILLIGVDAARGGLGADPSVPIFNDIVLSIPLGMIAFFFWHFLRWVRLDEAAAAA